MALRPVQVNIKALDPSAVGRFWAQALGWTAHSPGVTTYVAPGPGALSESAAGPLPGSAADSEPRSEPGDTLVWPDPVAVGIDVVPVPEPKSPTKNRVHLDLATTSPAHQAELTARLEALRATPVHVGQGAVPWTVLADPEGNEFCVLEPREVYRDTGPIAAIVVDCADPRAMARFWDAALEWTLHEVSDDYARFRSAQGVGPYVEFIRTPDVKTVPDRVHLDLLPHAGDDKEAEVSRLRALGATDLDLGQGDVPWTCLSDPEGHEFCVLALH